MKKILRFKKKRVFSFLLALCLMMLCACSKESKIANVISKQWISPEQKKMLEELDWIEVGSRTDKQELRSAWDELLGVTGDTGNKSGGPYVTSDGENDNNITLQKALHNYDYYTYFDKTCDARVSEKLYEAVKEYYEDSEDTSLFESASLYMGLNAYFNILKDNQEKYCGWEESLTRAEAMSGLMKATRPVSPDISEDEDFKKAVGESQYNVFAQELNKTSFVSTEDGSLNSETYNEPITRGEVVYMLINTYYPSSLETVSIDGDTPFVKQYYLDIENAGNIAEKHGFTGEASAIKVVEYMAENPDEGVDERLFKAFDVALKKKIITPTDFYARLTEPCTRAEYMEMLVKTLAFDGSVERFSSSEPIVDKYGNTYYSLEEKLLKYDYDLINGRVVTKPSDMFPNGQTEYEVDSWAIWQKYWEDFSLYGTMSGGTRDQMPCFGDTGYNEDYLVEKTTDKGALCAVDTRTGKIYYPGMFMPTGRQFDGNVASSTIDLYYIADHEDQCEWGVYSLTYEMMQDCYGYPVD